MDSGTLIASRYRLERVIASGGMGSVWRAQDERLERVVAVKILHAGLDGSQHPRDRFEREAKALASLKGPGWVEVYDFGEEPDGDREALYLVMELVEGVSLAELLHREERLDPARTMRIVAEAAEALATAHRRGIVHRDVKPGNILIDADDRVRVVDFGISLFAHRARLTPTDAVLGTAPYVSPEQLRAKGVTGSSDLYSLGAVAYECLTGAPPFDAEDPAAIIHGHLYSEPPALPGDVPAAIAGVVTRTLRKTPEERWESGEVLAAACRAATTGEHPAATIGEGPVAGQAAGQAAAGEGETADREAGEQVPAAAAAAGGKETADREAGERVPAAAIADRGKEAVGREAGEQVPASAAAGGPAAAHTADRAARGDAAGTADEGAVPLEAGPVAPFSTPVEPPTPPQAAAGTPEEPRERRGLVLLAAAVAAVVAILAIVIWGPWGGDPPERPEAGDGGATADVATSAGEDSGDPSPSGDPSASPTGAATPTEPATTPEGTDTDQGGTGAGGESGGTDDDGGGSDDGGSDGGGETDAEDQPKEGSGTVPTVTGMTTFEARDALEEEGFTNVVANVGYYYFNPEPEHCQVMMQNPRPGQTADYAEQISVSYHERQAVGTACDW